MSIQYALSQENLGKKYCLSEDDKPSDSTMAGNSGSPLPSSKIPLMKDKSSNEPNRIGFLNQCKLELSAEVIRWKEENHRLRKEKETSDQKICELQSLLDRFSRRNEELEASLHSSNQDYEKLKMHSLAIYEENRVLHKKLSKTCSKYYSYPWSEFGVTPVFPYLNGSAAQHPRTDVGAAGSWEEVSQKLLEQMKLEMKELQELGQKLAINELPPNSGDRRHSSTSVKDPVSQEQNVCGNGVEDSITDLTHDFESLKQRLKSQHQKLTLLLSQTSLDCQNYAFSADSVANHYQNNIPADRKADSVISFLDWETTDAAEQKFVRPSDESFRAYFTQQLSNSKSAEELKRMMNFYLDGSKDFSDQSSNQSNVQKKGKASCSFSPQNQPKDSHAVDIQTTLHQDSRNVCPDEALAKVVTNKSQNAPKNCFVEEERVCPICEAVFPRVFSQKEFESHVVAHLEAESASLLDQYEIL